MKLKYLKSIDLIKPFAGWSSLRIKYVKEKSKKEKYINFSISYTRDSHWDIIDTIKEFISDQFYQTRTITFDREDQGEVFLSLNRDYLVINFINDSEESFILLLNGITIEDVCISLLEQLYSQAYNWINDFAIGEKEYNESNLNHFTTEIQNLLKQLKELKGGK